MAFALWMSKMCCPGSNNSKRKIAEQWQLTSPESVEPGAEIVLSWKIAEPDSDSGWIGIYETTGVKDTDFLDYQCFEGKEGQIIFSSKKLSVGKEYEARIFAVDDASEYILKGRSSAFVLGTWLVGVPPRIDQGSEIIVQYAAPSNYGSAWVGIYRASASDDDCLQWSWVKGNEGSLQFKAAGMKPDYAYEARIYQDDGKTGYSFKARSGLFVVMPR